MSPRPRRILSLAIAVVVCAWPEPGSAACRRTCATVVATCTRERCATVHGSARRRCVRECRGSAGCRGGFGTLAYVVSSCRVRDGKLTGWQELRIRRDRCDPVTVLRFENAEPLDDRFGVCSIVSRFHNGDVSPFAGVFQRLGVTRDGSGVVFDVSAELQQAFPRPTPLAADAQGVFYVRADGTGLRRLGPPIRVPAYDVESGVGVVPRTRFTFSQDDRRVAFVDLGPGPDGPATQQVFAMEIATGERRQLTRLSHPLPSTLESRSIPHLGFDAPDVIGLNHAVGDDFTYVWVRLDGTIVRTETNPEPGTLGSGEVVRQFGVVAPGLNVSRWPVPGMPEDYGPFASREGIKEVFRKLGSDHWVQLTHFRSSDTDVLAARPGGILAVSSTNPLGTNPLHNCQLFRVGPYGQRVRQLTQFGTVRSVKGCIIGDGAGCAVAFVNQEVLSRANVFSSDCDPFGTNPGGSQAFAIGLDGSRLQQLTSTPPPRVHPDGTLEVEFVGPVARGGR